MNLGEELLNLCEARGDEPALVSAQGRTVTYHGFRERALAAAARLHDRKLTVGARVGVCTPVSVDLYAGVVGAWTIGAIPVFPEASRGLRTVLRTLDEAALDGLMMPFGLGTLRLLQPGLLSLPRVSAGGRSHRGPAFVERGDDEAAMISYSSGTTGKPKEIVRTHGVLAAQARAVGNALGVEPSDRLYTTMPGFVLSALANGQTGVLGGRLPVTADFLAKRNVTRLLGAPAFFRRLLSRPDVRPLNIARIDVGGALVTWSLLEALAVRFPGARIVSVFGATEAEPIACQSFRDASIEDRAAFDRGDGMLVGKPVAGLEVRIEPVPGLAEGGELRVAGAAVISSGEDGYCTGDLVRLDDDGRMWLLGRRSAAWKGPDGLVPPLAVEGPALTTPGVTRAALIGKRGTLVVEAGREALERILLVLKRQPRLRGLRLLRHAVPVEQRHHSKPDLGLLDQIVKREIDHVVTI